MKHPFSKIAKLVSLKRRKTEQDFRAAQLELNRLEARAKQLESELKSVDLQQHGFSATRLAYQHGYVQFLVREMSIHGDELSRHGRDFENRRDALKRTLDSEDRIKRDKLIRR